MSLLDFFFPKKCVGCGKFGEYICFSCFSLLSFNATTKCLICERPSLDGLTHPGCRGIYTIDGYLAAVSYKSIARKLLYQFKYNPYLTDLQTTLGDLLYENLIQQEIWMTIISEKPLLVPIPLTKNKLRKRGYNQSEILAKNIGKRFGLEVASILQRVKETKPQYGLKREERIKNMRNAFDIVNRSLLIVHSRIKTAVLVDDVVTTGATFRDAANVLKRNGFSKVWGVVLAQD